MNLLNFTKTPPEEQWTPAKVRQYADSYLASQGFTPVQRGAILGNLHQESGGFNHLAVNKVSEAFGLAQWIGPRIKNLKKLYPDTWQTPQAQMEFLVREINGEFPDGWAGHKRNRDIFFNTDNLAEATKAFAFGFERMGKEEARMDIRYKKAAEYSGLPIEDLSNFSHSAQYYAGTPRGNNNLFAAAGAMEHLEERESASQQYGELQLQREEETAKAKQEEIKQAENINMYRQLLKEQQDRFNMEIAGVHKGMESTIEAVNRLAAIQGQEPQQQPSNSQEGQPYVPETIQFLNQIILGSPQQEQQMS